MNPHIASCECRFAEAASCARASHGYDMSSSTSLKMSHASLGSAAIKWLSRASLKNSSSVELVDG